MAKPNTSAGKLTPFFQNVERLTKPQRIAIYASTLVVIVGLSIWFLFLPKYKKIEGLAKQLVNVQQELQKAKKNAAELNDWRNKMKQKEANTRPSCVRFLKKRRFHLFWLEYLKLVGMLVWNFCCFNPKLRVPKGFMLKSRWTSM